VQAPQEGLGQAMESEKSESRTNYGSTDKEVRRMKSGEPIITKDLIAQHNLTDDEYRKIVEISGVSQI
jgi:hypothetical protein